MENIIVSFATCCKSKQAIVGGIQRIPVTLAYHSYKSGVLHNACISNFSSAELS